MNKSTVDHNKIHDSTLSMITDVLTAYCAEAGIPLWSIDELIFEHPEHKAVLQPLLDMWEANVEALDRELYPAKYDSGD